MKTRLPAFFTFLALWWVAPFARSTNLVWTNVAGGDWKNAANWEPHQVPGEADTAIITAAGAYTVTVSGAAKIAAFELGTAAANGPQQRMVVNNPRGGVKESSTFRFISALPHRLLPGTNRLDSTGKATSPITNTATPVFLSTRRVPTNVRRMNSRYAS